MRNINKFLKLIISFSKFSKSIYRTCFSSYKVKLSTWKSKTLMERTRLIEKVRIKMRIALHNESFIKYST